MHINSRATLQQFSGNSQQGQNKKKDPNGARSNLVYQADKLSRDRDRRKGKKAPFAPAEIKTARTNRRDEG